MTDITPIIEAVFALIAVVVSVIVIPYIRSKTTKDQQVQIEAWVRIAVTAAEQIYKETGMGAKKKEYVINWLKEHGIVVDDSKLEVLIEAAVYDLTHTTLIADAIVAPITTTEG